MTVSTAPECSWTAAAGAAWIVITSGATGQGNGTTDFRVSANPSMTARRGDVDVNGQRVGVEQAACAISLDATSFSAPANGGSGSVSVGGSPGCVWTATSSADWITITAGRNGAGPGSVGFAVAANTGQARAGSIAIGGLPFTITQPAAAPNCVAALAPASQNVGSQGGSGIVTVDIPPSCSWTAASNAGWITITSGRSGTGGGTVGFSVSSTTSARSGTLTIANQLFTITQAAPGDTCTYAISPTTRIVSRGGGSTFTDLSTGPSCQWSVASSAPWITAGGSGTGNARITVTVSPNPGPSARSGMVTIAGLGFTVSQCGNNSIGAAPPAFPSAGGSGGAVNVTADNGCAWTATSNASWITNVTPGGTGNGAVAFTVANNPGAPRTGTITVGSESLTVTQCGYSLSPTSQSFPSAGGPGGPVTVSTLPVCGWSTSVPPSSGIVMIGAGTGTGTGPFSYSVQPNPLCVVRTGTITVVSQSFTVTEAGAPPTATTLMPTTQTVPKAGGAFSVQVTSNCTWTVTNVPTTPAWIHFTVTSGLGPLLSLQYTVDLNPGTTQRAATVNIGGAALTVTQNP